jgi:hypothetical protein
MQNVIEKPRIAAASWELCRKVLKYQVVQSLTFLRPKKLNATASWNKTPENRSAAYDIRHELARINQGRDLLVRLFRVLEKTAHNYPDTRQKRRHFQLEILRRIPKQVGHSPSTS